MCRHVIDHSRARDDSKVAREYSRIEREQADAMSDPKVRAMTRGAHKDESKAIVTRLREFLRIERQGAES